MSRHLKASLQALVKVYDFAADSEGILGATDCVERCDLVHNRRLRANCLANSGFRVKIGVMLTYSARYVQNTPEV